MTRLSPTIALALLAGITLGVAGCSAGAAPAAPSASSPPTSAAPVAESEAPAESSAPTEAAPAEASDEQRRCEMVMMERFNDRAARPATADDIAAVTAAIEMAALPGSVSCGAVMDDGAYTQLLWVDQPTVAPELLEVLSSRGWEPTEEQATGYTITGYATDGFTVSVAPIGVDNAMSAWGSIWPGMDVTVLGFETS